MALGFGKKSDSSSPISSPSTGKATDPELLTKDGYLAADTTAAEHGGRKPRKKMNRIDGPITKPIGGENVLNDDATDSDVSIGKQMEKEAGNAIKYRTCSWQKVRYSFPFDPFAMEASHVLADDSLAAVALLSAAARRMRFVATVALAAEAS
jgi:hypothetical protein